MEGLDPELASRFRPVRGLGSGQFGTAVLMEDRLANELVAVKFLERGKKIDKNVERELLNHMQLSGHPNVVGFKEAFLTPTHLGIVMDYCTGGELFQRVADCGAFPEDEARYFFQQLISGLAWCHKQGVCHRDLKLENSLLDGGPAYRLKICDFGYSKNMSRDSAPKTLCGTPAYVSPEVLQHKRYDGKMADVWSCGVLLYVMLVGAYPFEDPARPNDFEQTIKRIMAAKYNIPPHIHLSRDCLNLLDRVFKPDPARRITLGQIRKHPWFLKNLPEEMQDDDAMLVHATPRFRQSVEEIKQLVAEARSVPVA